MNYDIYKKEIYNNKTTKKIINKVTYNNVKYDYNMLFISYNYLQYLNNINIEINYYYEISKKYNFIHMKKINKENIKKEYENLLTYLKVILNLKYHYYYLVI